MDNKSWMNLIKTTYNVNDKRLSVFGVDISYESVEGYYSSFSAISRQTRMIAKVTLADHYSPERVTIEGDANLVHTILEKLK